MPEIARHSPGPWARRPYHNGERMGLHVADANGDDVAYVRGWEGEDSTFEANADLIAAATELLAAARIALVAFNGYEQAGIMVPRDEGREKIRAAIAKAEGRLAATPTPESEDR